MSEWWSAFLDGAFVTGMFYTLLVWATVRSWERKNFKKAKSEVRPGGDDPIIVIGPSRTGKGWSFSSDDRGRLVELILRGRDSEPATSPVILGEQR